MDIKTKNMGRSRLELKQKGQFRQRHTATIANRPEKLMNPLETPSSHIRRVGIDAPALHALACT